MPTLNGKLIVPEKTELKNLDLKIENMTQQFQLKIENMTQQFQQEFCQVESRLTLRSKQEHTEHLKQLKLANQSLQNLEQIYKQLLVTTIVTAISLTSLSIWIGLTARTASEKQAKSTELILLASYSSSLPISE